MKVSHILFTLCMMASAATQANEFNYSQAALSYISGENDNGSEFDGYEITLAYDVNRLVYGLRIQFLEQNSLGGTIDSALYTGGIGSYWEISTGLDLYASVYAGQYDVETPSTKLADSSVIILTAGMRKQLTEQLQGQFYLASYQFDQDVEDQTRFGAVLEYTPANSAFGVRGTYETHSDADQFYLGVVFNY